MTDASNELSLDAPTILFVGEGERFEAALRQYLEQHGAQVETALPAEVGTTAFITAPDLVVLAGEAAADHGAAALAALNSNPVTATLPVALIADASSSRPVDAFRHGVVAVVERSASADEMARRIADIAKELPDREGQTEGTLGLANAEELVELLAESLRSGLLSVRNEAGESTQIVLRADRPLETMMAELVERIRPLAQGEQGALRYEFHETAPSRIATLDDDEDGEGSLGQLADRRLLVIEQDPARSDLLAQDLRRAGATVVVIGGSGEGLELARELQPEVVVVDGAGVEGWALGALRAIRRDPWLRWASLLLVDAERLWRDPRRPDIALLASSVHGLVEPDRDLAEQASEHEQLDTRLETVGPIRLLRALTSTGLGLRVRVQHRRVALELDVADGLIAGARATPLGRKEEVGGPRALSALLGLSAARVSIEHAPAPRSTDLMAPVDAAIRAAAAERPLVAPSLPPPSLEPPQEKAPENERVEPSEVRALVSQLEGLLSRLKEEAGEDREGSEEPGAAQAIAAAKEATAEPAGAEPADAESIRAARPDASELPEYDEDEDEDQSEPGDDSTSTYNPELMDRLRKRMRSQPKMRALRTPPRPIARPGSKGSRPDISVPPPRAKLPPPKRPLGSNTKTPAMKIPTQKLAEIAAARKAEAEGAGAKEAAPEEAAPSKTRAKDVEAKKAAARRAARAADPAADPAAKAADPAAAKEPLGKEPLGKKPLEKKPLGKKPLEKKPLGKKPLGKKPLEVESAARAKPSAGSKPAAGDEPAAAKPSPPVGAAAKGAAARSAPKRKRRRRNPTLVMGSAGTEEAAGLAPEPQPPTAVPVPTRGRASLEASEAGSPGEASAPGADEEDASATEGEGIEAPPAQHDEAPETALDIQLPQETSVDVVMPAEASDDLQLFEEPTDALIAKAEHDAADEVKTFGPPADPLAPTEPADPGPALQPREGFDAPGAPPEASGDLFDRSAGASPVGASPLAEEPAARSRAPVIALGVVGGLVVLGGLAAGIYFASSGPDEPEPRDTVTMPGDEPDPTTEGETTEGEGEAAEGGGAETAEGEGETAEGEGEAAEGEGEAAEGEGEAAEGGPGVPAVVRIAPGDPVVGSDEDFDLSTFGVQPADPPPSRLAARRRTRSLIRDANRARRDEEYERAEPLYREILGIDPDNPRAMIGLARIYLARDEPGPALLLAQRQCRLRPEIANNFVFLGDILRDAGDVDGARRAYERGTQARHGGRRAQERLEELDEPSE